MFERVKELTYGLDGSKLAALVEVRGWERMEQLVAGGQATDALENEQKELDFKTRFQHGLAEIHEGVRLLFCQETASPLLKKFGIAATKLPAPTKDDRCVLLEQKGVDTSLQKFVQGFTVCEILQLLKKTHSAGDVKSALQKAIKARKVFGETSVNIPEVKWDDVGGLADAKEEILRTIMLP